MATNDREEVKDDADLHGNQVPSPEFQVPASSFQGPALGSSVPPPGSDFRLPGRMVSLVSEEMEIFLKYKENCLDTKGSS